MAKNYWIIEAKYQQNIAEQEQETKAVTKDRSITSPISDTYSSICQNDKVLGSFLNDFRQLRQEISSQSTSSPSKKDDLNIID